MKDIFSNKIGTEIFARYFFGLTESLPSDRVIDKEYQLLSKRSLLDKNVEWLSVEPPVYKVTVLGEFHNEN